jgi:hypothetical protein
MEDNKDDVIYFDPGLDDWYYYDAYDNNEET